MELDTHEGCQACGILSVTLSKRGNKQFCKACKCAQAAELVWLTPCGQQYCKWCGILIDLKIAETCQPGYCMACTVIQRVLIRLGDSRRTDNVCKCEFCSNHYGVTPPERKYVKLGIEPFARKPSGEGSVGTRESDTQNKHHEGPRENLVEEEVRNKWEREQLSLKKQLMTRDCPAVKRIMQAIKDTSKTFYIGGVDISFIKDNNVDACAALIIISFPDLQVVYKRLEMIQLTAPYIPGFLAFREVEPLVQLYRTMLTNAPHYKPDVIFVDGNGQLHPRAFGLACQLGVVLDIPCVGVAKTLIHVDGIEDNADHKAKKQSLQKEGDTFALTTSSGDTLGMALRSTRSASNPIYVSVGHKISLQSAVSLVQRCCKYRIPEPTRFADLYSRQYLMDKCQEPEELIVGADDTPPGDWQ